jgi:hypothetical protein
MTITYWKNAATTSLRTDVGMAILDRTIVAILDRTIDAVDDLKNAVRNARRLRPGVVPMISLEWQAMRTTHGMKSKPHLKIVDWSIPGAEVSAIAHDSSGMNDPIT